MIKELKIKLARQALKTPFQVAVKHKSTTCIETRTILVHVENNYGLQGYGESCPCEYLLYESTESITRFFDLHYQDIIFNIYDLDSLIQWIEDHEQDIDNNPASWCAIELALLDLFAKEKQMSVEKLLGLPPITGQFQYSAILADNREDYYLQQVRHYVEMGFSDFKVNLSGHLKLDRNKLSQLDSIADKPHRVRIDANNLWHTVKEAVDYIHALDYPLFAVEEPLISKNIPELQQLSNKLSLPIILDESSARNAHFNLWQCTPSHHWVLKLRISKVGGLLRSLDIIHRACDLHIPIIIGSQAGETSILTRAAITAAIAGQSNIIAQEGAFGTWLLQEDICKPSVMFGQAGMLNTHDFQFNVKHGFGLNTIVH